MPIRIAISVFDNEEVYTKPFHCNGVFLMLRISFLPRNSPMQRKTVHVTAISVNFGGPY
jgi:hypothetical protein